MIDKDICGTCIHFDPNSNINFNGEYIGHICDKKQVCEYYSLHNGCKDYECKDCEYKEKTENEFKPCPFCGNKDITIKKVSHNAGMDRSYDNWSIKCGVCFAGMNVPADNFYGREYYTEEEAITMWNHRKEA